MDLYISGSDGFDMHRRIISEYDLGDKAIYNKIVGIPHITIATNAGGKPVMSNEFSDADFEPIEPITVCGKVEEVPR